MHSLTLIQKTVARHFWSSEHSENYISEMSDGTCRAFGRDENGIAHLLKDTIIPEDAKYIIALSDSRPSKMELDEIFCGRVNPARRQYLNAKRAAARGNM